MTGFNGDIAGFLRSMKSLSAPERIAKPLVGIDECLNRREINELVRTLLQADLVDGSNPLWYETRERDGVIVGSFLGGVDKDSHLRKPNSLLPDIGVPIKARSWSDGRVVQALVVNFLTHDNLILLSENTRKDKGGLRRILNEIVVPAIALRSEPLCITALFKKGKTDVNHYCLDVIEFLKKPDKNVGYVEVML